MPGRRFNRDQHRSGSGHSKINEYISQKNEAKETVRYYCQLLQNENLTNEVREKYKIERDIAQGIASDMDNKISEYDKND